MDPHEESCRIVGVHFCLCEKVPAVDQAETDGLSLKFVGIRPFKYHKRVVVVGRIPSHASHGLDSLLQMPCLRITFSRPCSGKLDPVIIAVRKIHA